MIQTHHPLVHTTIPRSSTLHLDYIGALPERCTSGTLYFMVSCWGLYTHIGLKGDKTADALTKSVDFSRGKRVHLDKLRMGNQSSGFRDAAVKLGLATQLVSAKQKEANRSERATQKAKAHIIATRAGFHRECPHTYPDMCLPQIELTLTMLHPLEYNPHISAYQRLFGVPFDFMTHPIAPAGSKVLSWDSPDNRGSCADHGTPGIYMGPALQHFRVFQIRIPETSALRISVTVWWFLAPFNTADNLVALENTEVSYPPIRDQPKPQANGADLLGRFFFEPELGVCCISYLVRWWKNG
jgi:hypothetical protein